MYQQIIVVGNLGADPEMRYLENGTPVTNFSLATNRRWKNQQTDEMNEETFWFRVSVFGKQAESVQQYMTKGRQVLVTGRLRGDPQTGGPKTFVRQDGTVSASFEITADSVRFLQGGGEQQGVQQQAEQALQQGQQQAAGYEEDKIPF